MDVNVIAFGPKSKGVTPLHLAAEGSHLDLMDELLDHGADIDARAKGACGWTLLHSAAKARKREAVKFLIENGAFLPEGINDSRFNPPLHYCSGLEWAYEEMKRLHLDSFSAGEISGSSGSQTVVQTEPAPVGLLLELLYEMLTILAVELTLVDDEGVK